MSATNNVAAAILRDVKLAIREPYAWPGGYPKFVVMKDGATLSCTSARKEWRSICASTIQDARDGWDAAGVDINYEDPALFCDHSGERIESAYAEPETEESAP